MNTQDAELKRQIVLLLTLLLVTPASLNLAAAPQPPEPPLRSQEKQCIGTGWQRQIVAIEGLQRSILWKGPSGTWAKGAIILLHGGGGEHFQWCVANARIVAPQVRFTELAIQNGFAVFLLNSSDQVTDNQNRVCGKVWDDEVRNRPNLDLPFISHVIHDLIPKHRPANSKQEIFLTGLSSGGYMTLRAATHFDDSISAFAPVSSGDPYGWHRNCEAGLTLRKKVHGAGYDNETGKQIPEKDACLSDRYPNEKAWDTKNPATKPAFRMFFHKKDGINDASCATKASRLLRQHGYPGQPDFVLSGGRRGLVNHLWQDDYNQPILDFFTHPFETR